MVSPTQLYWRYHSLPLSRRYDLIIRSCKVLKPQNLHHKCLIVLKLDKHVGSSAACQIVYCHKWNYNLTTLRLHTRSYNKTCSRYRESIMVKRHLWAFISLCILRNTDINSLIHGRFEWNLKQVILEFISFIHDRFPLGNCPQMNVTEPYWWSANCGLGKGLEPSSTTPLPEPMLTQIYVDIRLCQATMS